MTRGAEIVRALAALLFVAAFPNRSFALDPSQPFSSYLQTHFTPQDGFLPSGIVDDIVQSRDGFLWLIVNGRFLVRFDGQHFTGFDEPANVRALAMAPNGDLWLGTTDHLKRIPAAALNQFGRFPGVSYHPGPGGSSNIVCLHVSRDGALWVVQRLVCIASRMALFCQSCGGWPSTELKKLQIHIFWPSRRQGS